MPVNLLQGATGAASRRARPTMPNGGPQRSSQVGGSYQGGPSRQEFYPPFNPDQEAYDYRQYDANQSHNPWGSGGAASGFGMAPPGPPGGPGSFLGSYGAAPQPSRPPSGGSPGIDPYAGIGEAMMQTQQSLQMLAAVMTDDRRRRDTQQGYRQLKPKRDVSAVTASSREGLIDELTQFEIDMNEVGMNMFSEASFFQLRAISSGRVKDVIEYEFALAPQLRSHQHGISLPVADPRRT